MSKADMTMTQEEINKQEQNELPQKEIQKDDDFLKYYFNDNGEKIRELIRQFFPWKGG